VRDGWKKALIIGTTAGLPRRWRVAARESGLSRLEEAKARRARLLIIGHPKSGNTWLKLMLSRLYQVRYGLPEELVHKTDEYTRVDPRVPRLAASNGHYSYERAVARLFDGPDPVMKDKAVLLLARHPIDIAVSWYFQFTKRQSRHKQELINANLAKPIDRHTIEMWEFVRHSEIGLVSLIDFLNGWQERIERVDRAQMIRYEDLRTEPVKTLGQVTQLIGDPFGEDEIRAAVDYGSFDNVRALESQGYFKQGGLTLRNPDDPESFKVRRGKIGGYRDYFDDAQVAELEAITRERLSPFFGYAALGASGSTRT